MGWGDVRYCFAMGGCCSCQVSSISVLRVTCYENFRVFHFFSILAVSMATTAGITMETAVPK
jgi:hypothetical protein